MRIRRRRNWRCYNDEVVAEEDVEGMDEGVMEDVVGDEDERVTEMGD